MSTPPRDPSFPPSRQDYRDLIDHHYVIRGLTFAPLILFPIAMKTGAQYGPLSLWTGIGMNLSILLTCLTIPLAIPVMLRDAREAQARGVDKAIPRRRRWKAAGRVAIAISFGILSTVRIVPLVRDLASGPKPVTVTSCTSSVADREWRSGRRGSRTTTIYQVYEITMQLADGSTRVQDISLQPQDSEPANSLAIYDTLYDACVTHPGQTPMTLQVMPRSWRIIEAHLG